MPTSVTLACTVAQLQQSPLSSLRLRLGLLFIINQVCLYIIRSPRQQGVTTPILILMSQRFHHRFIFRYILEHFSHENGSSTSCITHYQGEPSIIDKTKVSFQGVLVLLTGLRDLKDHLNSRQNRS